MWSKYLSHHIVFNMIRTFVHSGRGNSPQYLFMYIINEFNNSKNNLQTPSHRRIIYFDVLFCSSPHTLPTLTKLTSNTYSNDTTSEIYVYISIYDKNLSNIHQNTKHLLKM